MGQLYGNYVANVCRDASIAATCSSRRRRRKSRNEAMRRSRAAWHSCSFTDNIGSLVVTVLRRVAEAGWDKDEDGDSLSMLPRSNSSCCACRRRASSLRAFYKHHPVTHHYIPLLRTHIEIQQPLPEWSNCCGSESSTGTDVYVWRYALLVMHAKNDYDKWQCQKYSTWVICMVHSATLCDIIITHQEMQVITYFNHV